MDKNPCLEFNLEMKEILQNEIFYDINLVCSDGHIAHNRLVVGLIFPSLKCCPTFQFPISQTVLLPQFTMEEISKMIVNSLDESNGGSAMLDDVLFVPVNDEENDAGFVNDEVNNGFNENEPPDYMQIQPEVPFFDDGMEDYDEDYPIGENYYEEALESSYDIQNQCNVCSLVCKSRRQLQNHLKTHEKFRSRNYPCPICPKRFYWEKDVKRHTRDIHGVGAPPPTNPNSPKQTNDNLTREITQVTEMPEIPPMKIKEEVNYVQVGKIKLSKPPTNHLKAAADPPVRRRAQLAPHSHKPFKCQFCGKGFKTKSYVKTHENTIHQENRPLLYQCDQCPDKKFLHMASLKNHNRTVHEDEDLSELLYSESI